MTPPIERTAKADSPPRDPDIDRLVHGRLHEPRRVLGPHAVGADSVLVRVLLPNAVRARLVEPAVELVHIPGTPLFEWKGLHASLPANYRIRFESHDGRWNEGYDPYSFPLEIDESDLARFAGGSHIHA